MSSPLPYRLVVFDWDGTLMDSVATIVECTTAVRRELGLEELDPQRVRETVGLGLDDVFRRLYPEAGAQQREQVIEAYRRHWVETFHRRLHLFDGAEEVLETLGSQRYVLAVATGKSRMGLDRDLAATGLAGRFAATRTVTETRSKPHPQMLFELLDELSVPATETLVVGDTTFDLEMARAAGCDAVGVLSGGHRREELETARPRTLLETVRDLPGWLTDRAGNG